MSKARATVTLVESTPQTETEGAERPAVQPEPEQPAKTVQWAYSGPPRARSHVDEPPGLYAYQDLIAAGLHRLLGGLIGDGAKLMLIVDHGGAVEVVGSHPDPWSVLDSLVCSEDDEPGAGPGSRGRLVN